MSRINPLIPIALGGAALLVFNRLQTASVAPRLNYVIKGLSADFKVLSVQINVDIGIQNPTSTSVIIKSFTGNLYLNTFYLGNVSNMTATEIAANSQTTYRVAILINTLSLPGPVLTMLQNYSGIDVKLDGTINVDNIVVPLPALHFKWG